MSYIKLERLTNMHCSNIFVITFEPIPQPYPCKPKIGLLTPNPFPFNYGSYTNAPFHVPSNHPVERFLKFDFDLSLD